MSTMGGLAGIISWLAMAGLVACLVAGLVVGYFFQVRALKRHRDKLALENLNYSHTLSRTCVEYLDLSQKSCARDIQLRQDVTTARLDSINVRDQLERLTVAFDNVRELSEKALAALGGVAQAARVKVPYCRLPEVIADIVAERDRFAADSEVQRAKVAELGQQLALSSVTKVLYSYPCPPKARSHKRKA